MDNIKASTAHPGSVVEIGDGQVAYALAQQVDRPSLAIVPRQAWSRLEYLQRKRPVGSLLTAVWDTALQELPAFLSNHPQVGKLASIMPACLWLPLHAPSFRSNP